MKKLLVLLLLFSFLVVGCSGDRKEKKLQATELTDKYQIESVSEENTYGDVHTVFTYPVIKDLIDKRIEDKINSTISARIEDYRSLVSVSEEFGLEETMTVWYEVPFRSKEKLSIKFYIQSHIKQEDYTDITIDTYNFDLNSGEDIPLADLFKLKTYKDKLNSILQVKFNELDVKTNKQFAGLDEDQDYYLKDDKLVIYYQSLIYTDDEPLEFEIPFADISDMLKAPIN
ncbi:hypothetical protein [Acetivibrio straminisolvens]|uniref:DUF3298 domain-containing protein n=1 Tax=Acetivibrio straminisolvens JCM 21531 TaxID=1294263 RepID=W4V825_9FIRM|nr:hypothetical protein [Acetivibrio straminisolvens]GAE88948.1 hypothetical protein JCM21531_2434 [Acetivibrio straminisolvens JCM 21531]